MADRIKGITIEIDGQTTGLKAALNDITKQSIDIQKELKDVDRLLKFDPGNTSALAQKQELLSKQIEITSQKLQALKDAQSQVDTQFSRGEIGEQQYRAFQREIEFTEASLNRFKATAAEVGNNSGQIQKMENNFKGLDQEIKKTAEDEKKLSLAEGLNKLESGVSSAKGKILDLKNVFLGISAAAAGGFGLFEFTEKAIEAGDNSYKLSQKLHLTTAETASLSKIFSITGTDTTAFASTMTKLDKSILGAGESGNSTTKMLERYGVSLTDTSGKLLPMNQQLDALAAAYQKSADAGEEDAFSAEVLGNKGAALIPLLENYTEAKEAASKVKGIGIDPKQAHETEEELKVLKMQVAATGGVMAKALIPIVQAVLPPLITLFQNIAVKVKENKAEIDKFIKSVIEVGKQLVATVAPVIKEIFGFIAEHGEESGKIIKDLILGFTAFEGINKFVEPLIGAIGTLLPILAGTAESTGLIGIAIEALTGPIGWIIAAVAGVIGIFTVLYNTNEDFRNSANEAWEEIKTTISEAVDAIEAIISQFVEIGSEIWAKYGDQITKILMDKWNSIKIVFETALNAIKDILNIVLALIKGDWQGVWDGIKQLFTDVWNGIIAYWSSVGTQLYDTINLFTGGALTAISNFINSIIAWFMDLPNKANTLWQNITTAFSNGWNAIVTFFTQSIPAWIQSVGVWFLELPNKIAYALGLVVGTLASWGISVWTYLSTNVPQWIDSIGAWFSQLPSSIMTWLTNVITNIQTWGSNMLTEATTAATNTYNAIINWFTQLPGSIETWLTNVITNIQTWGSNMLTEATTAATNTYNAVISWFTQLPAGIETWLSSCVTNVTTWGSSMLSEATTGMQNVFNGIVDTFTNLPSRMTEIGTNIVAGIKQGILDAWEGMKGWMGGLCDSFVDGVKEKLDIHSPSRVMRQLGVYTGEGFGLGIGDTVNSISKQANAIAEAAMPNVNSGTYDMGVNYSPIGGTSVGSTGNNLDAILAKMDSLTDAITNMKILMDSKEVGKLVTPTVSNNLAFNNGRRGW